jgi:biopolymer transport protein ExbB
MNKPPWGLTFGLMSILICATIVVLFGHGTGRRACAQDPLSSEEEALAASRLERATPSVEDTSTAPRREQRELNLLWLLAQGGALMWVLAGMCVAAVAIAIERLLSLRRERLLPQGLARQLGAMHAGSGQFDPRDAYRICDQHPSAAANVIKSMLLKVGRPQSEVEYAVSEACQRESDQLMSGVQWLNLIATVAPLVGLLGTVWGMIHAFYITTQLAPGQNKAVFLAEGIYTALVTTLGGLVIAIPAAVCAYYFESVIQREFRRMDEMLANLLPHVERYEGKQRLTRANFDT